MSYQGKHYSLYEASQKQRQVERAIRKQKNRILVAEATGDKEQLQIAQIRLGRLNEEYLLFSRATGQRTQRERAWVAGFGRGQAARASSTVVKYSQVRYNKDGTIVVTDDWTKKEHPSIPKHYKPNAVIDTTSANGKQRDRTIYDSDGQMKLQVHSGNHGNPKKHPYGKHGEHSHDYTWLDDSEKPNRITREASDEERVHNAEFWEVRKMTVDQFKEIMCCNEPDFGYNGQEYSICWPDGKYYVTASDSPSDIDLEFYSLDDLLDHWIIQGKTLRQILPHIDLN